MLNHQNNIQFFWCAMHQLHEIKLSMFSELQVTYRLVKFENDKTQRPSIKCI